MAYQQSAPKLTEDQPPAYPNDKPPEYHDIFPRQTVPPPPVDIPPPDNTPAVRIPHVSTTTVTSTAVYNSSHIVDPPQTVVVTQPATSTSHHNNANESQHQNKKIDCYDICWKFLLVLSVIAAIIAPPIGIHACVWACVGYNSKEEAVQKSGALVAIIMCTITYVGVTIVAIVVPITLA